MDSFLESYIEDSIRILQKVNKDDIENVLSEIKKVKYRNGRIFFVGVGGGAAHASHAVNDFRKIANIESYCVTDNVAELTARVNDDSWNNSYVEWIKLNKLRESDLVFVFSVGGGDAERNISNNIVNLLKYVREETEAKIVGIIGPNGGYTKKVADACVIIPINMYDPISKNYITPHTEGFQSIFSHLIVSHPEIMYYNTKWETKYKE
jgi:D-sedoheptulose 7-phosphate isomerase